MLQQLYLLAQDDRLVDLLLLHHYGIINPAEKEEMLIMLQLPAARDAYGAFKKWEQEEMQFCYNN